MQPFRKHPPKRKPIAPNRQVAWARRERAKLITLLGGKCEKCGESDPANLEFNHTSPRNWEPRKHSQWGRIFRYRRDYAAGILNLLCRSCNASVGYPDGQQELLDKKRLEKDGEAPF
jgi:hypothetical protein